MKQSVVLLYILTFSCFFFLTHAKVGELYPIKPSTLTFNPNLNFDDSITGVLQEKIHKQNTMTFFDPNLSFIDSLIGVLLKKIHKQKTVTFPEEKTQEKTEQIKKFVPFFSESTQDLKLIFLKNNRIIP